ncbi:MAG: serine hydrolase [Sphingomicrobium sp.]
MSAFFAQPALAASSPDMVTVERQLAYLVGSRSGEYGIAALDLSNGRSVSINGDEPFPLASTVKLAVAGAYLAQVDHGRRNLNDRIGSRSAAQLIELMLTRSDNAATDVLIRNLGGPGSVQEWLNFNNLPGIRIDRTIAQLLSAKRDLMDRRDSGSPLSMIAFLRQLDRGTMLKPQSRAYLLSAMGRCITGRNRMKALLPTGTRVEHKTGTLNGLTGDVGFITMPDGRRLAVAFFARGGTDRPRTIAEAAKAIYDGFRGSWGGSMFSTWGATGGASN